MIDNKIVFRLIPIRLHKRQLHAMQFSGGNFRRKYGGTLSMGLKRGALVKHRKHGLTYVGGIPKKERITLHSIITGKRISLDVKPCDCKFICFNKHRFFLAR